MLTCHDVARYFLAIDDEDSGELVSNLKVQKLVYYAQGFHLALYDKPLFPEPIQAWTHGPVVPVLYHDLKQYGANQIPPPVNMDYSLYTAETRELLDEVQSVLGQYSAWKLRNMTHREPPWCDAFAQAPGNVITWDALRCYFKTQLAK